MLTKTYEEKIEALERELGGLKSEMVQRIDAKLEGCIERAVRDLIDGVKGA